jgi:hypothetical protein
VIGWLALALFVRLEGAYKAISGRDARRSRAVRKLTELREVAIRTLLNRPVASLGEVERVKADIAAWVDETLARKAQWSASPFRSPCARIPEQPTEVAARPDRRTMRGGGRFAPDWLRATCPQSMGCRSPIAGPADPASSADG